MHRTVARHQHLLTHRPAVPGSRASRRVLGINQDPVTTKQIELEVTTRPRRWVQPRPLLAEADRQRLLVGLGPAGGPPPSNHPGGSHRHRFRARIASAGCWRAGIPEFKMESGILDRRLDQMRPKERNSGRVSTSGSTLAPKAALLISMRSYIGRWRNRFQRESCRSRPRVGGRRPSGDGVFAAGQPGARAR